MVKKNSSILVVDTDQEGARALAMSLKECGHSVLTARDGIHALSILEFRAFDALIVDVVSTGKESLTLIGWAGTMCPRPRIVAMADPKLAEAERETLEKGANLFLRKPVDFDRLIKFLEPSPARSSFTGTVEGVDIIEYLQFVILGGRKTILEITSSIGTAGRLYLVNGTVMHAECGVLQGEQALYRCLSFKDGTFSHLPWVEPERISVGKPGDFLLMEAMRKRDEAWGYGEEDEGT
jgi:CheY-like chemotaxis protein